MAIDNVFQWDGGKYIRVSRDLYESTRAALYSEEARAIAAETELARVRAEAERVRAFYEEREAKLKARIGGEMLRAEAAEKNALELSRELVWASLGKASLRIEAEKLRAMISCSDLETYDAGILCKEIARLRAVIERLESVPFTEET